MMIHIEAPTSYPAEREYILSVMFCEFLGVDIDIERTDRRDTRIALGDGGEIIISDGLFACPKEQWLKDVSLPRQPLEFWDTQELGIDLPLVTPKFPVIYGEPLAGGKWLQQDGNRIHLGLDIFGSAFFMLTRYEEVVRPDRDDHDRFPANGSLAYQEGFLDRPIVNEYLEILWASLKRIWPHCERKKREFKTLVSHDVDLPYSYLFNNAFKLLRNCAGDILLRQDVIGAIRRTSNWIKVKSGNPKADPSYTFDLMMDITERKGLRSTFYFFTDRLSQLDGNYSIHHPRIRTLLRLIHGRGHSIGLHGSYNSYQNPEQTKKEFQTLREVCDHEGIGQDQWGGRQHYLRWQTPITFKNLNDAGLDYDSTLSFADQAGFRCGVCYEYPAFDLFNKERLRIRERPLIVMECTITDTIYMGLGNGESALREIRKYNDICRKYHGDFTLLWHNSRFINTSDIALYTQAISE